MRRLFFGRCFDRVFGIASLAIVTGAGACADEPVHAAQVAANGSIRGNWELQAQVRSPMLPTEAATDLPQDAWIEWSTPSGNACAPQDLIVRTRPVVEECAVRLVVGPRLQSHTYAVRTVWKHGEQILAQSNGFLMPGEKPVTVAQLPAAQLIRTPSWTVELHFDDDADQLDEPALSLAWPQPALETNP